MAWTIWAYAPLRLGTARLCADTARIVFSLSVGSGALFFRYQKHITVGAKRFRCIVLLEDLRAPSRLQQHCWPRTHPLRGSIVHITILLLLTLMTTETRWCADTACWQGLHSHSPLVLALACWLPYVTPSAPYRRA